RRGRRWRRRRRARPIAAARPPLLGVLLLDVAAETEAHRRQHAVLEVVLAARGEALEKGGGEHVRRHRFIDGGGERPAALAGIGYRAGEVAEIGALGEG